MGTGLPRLDPRAVRAVPQMGIFQGVRDSGRFRRSARVSSSVLISGAFSSVLQQTLHTTLCSTRSSGGGILDPVAAIIIRLTVLGSIPELAAQALRAVIQPTPNKFLGCGFDLFFQTFLCCAFFLDFLDDLSPPTKGARAADAALASMFYAAASISDGRVVISL